MLGPAGGPRPATLPLGSASAPGRPGRGGLSPTLTRLIAKVTGPDSEVTLFSHGDETPAAAARRRPRARSEVDSKARRLNRPGACRR